MDLRYVLSHWWHTHVIPGWKQAWKFLSMQGMLLALTIQGVWVTLPDDWRASIPTPLIAGLTIACLIFGVIGRLYQQKGIDDGDKTST
jgi:hypothetical protein